MHPSYTFRAKLFTGMTRNILIVGIVSLFTDLSSEMVFPLIPLFLTAVLGMGACAVGIVEGAAETTASLLKVISGYWSDKLKTRKPFMLLGYSLSSITKPLFALANSYNFVLGIRVIERIGKGIRNAPRDAIVADSCDISVRGKAFGIHRTMDTIGATLGAVVAFLLLPILGYRNIFMLAFIPAIIGVFIILLIKEPPPQRSEKKIVLNFHSLPVKLKIFILISSIFGLGQFSYAFLLLRAKTIGLQDNIVILLYILFNIVYTICALPAGILSDKIGRKPVLVIGYLIFAITAMELIFTSIHSILIPFITYGIFYALTEGVQRAFVVDLAPEHLKATALGVFHMAIALVALPGGVIAGLLWDKISPTATFIYGATLAIISIVGLCRLSVSGGRLSV